MEIYFSCALLLFLIVYFLYDLQQESKWINAYKHVKKGAAFYCKNCKNLYLGRFDDISLKCPNCSKENTKLRF